MILTSYTVDNDRAFAKAIDEAKKAVGDLTIPLTLISKDFYKSERAIFNLKGPGQYPDLKESTKKQKAKKGFSVYPILKRTGRLEKSLLNPAAPESVNQIVNKRTLVIGTNVPYAVFHQEGTSKLPVRKHLFIGPEAPKFANSDQMGRLQRWTDILKAFVLQKSQTLGAVS